MGDLAEMAERQTAIYADRLLDGTGSPPVQNAAILLAGDRIVAVGPRASVKVPADATVVDLGARTLLPGLIDAHVHFYTAGVDNVQLRAIEPATRKTIRGVVGAAELLAAGYTSVRDMGYADSVHIKQAIEAGEIPGPRMLTPGRIIVQTGGSPDPYWLPLGFVREFDYRCRIADGADEIRRAAREQIRNGADFIKVMTSSGLADRLPIPGSYHYTLEELRAVAEEAHKVGLRLAAHAVSGPAIRNAVLAGAQTIEHGHYADDEALDAMAKGGVIFVPTLAVVRAFLKLSAKAEAAFANALDVVRKARERGVRIAAGSDFGGLPITRLGQNNKQECELLVEAGLSPAEVIEATTRGGAEAMGQADLVGTLEAGKLADIVATPADPLTAISGLRQIDFVMKGGTVVRDVK